MHASCLVIVPAEYADELESVVTAFMEPYNEHHNDEGWWDWWRIGGRWDGHHLGLASLPEETHYSAAWENPKRNMGDVKVAAEWQTFTVVSPEGYKHARCYNPEWVDNGYPPDVPAELDTPDFHQWRAEQLLKYRDGVAVVVDYHS
jgi:hypothetical protein